MRNRPIKNSRYRILYLLLLTIAQPVQAQVNYVLNPSLEQYSQCPDYYDQIKRATYWSCVDSLELYKAISNGIPEYLNVCANGGGFVGIPSSSYCYHYARTGNGMASVYMWNVDSSFYCQRDYLQGRLKQKLTPGTKYCVTFYVCAEYYASAAINHIGAYLDGGQIDTTVLPGQPQTRYTPQIVEDSIIADTLNWTKVEGSFIADGTEQFITIGNFFSHAQTAVYSFPSRGLATAIYLVDDISVVESDIPAYAGGVRFKGINDSVFIGRNEIVPDCEWYRNGVLIDTIHAGFWVKDVVNATYVVKQSICGNVQYDTVQVIIAPESVGSVGNAGDQNYSLYPNPNNGNVNLQQAVADAGPVNAEIWDGAGRKVYKGTLQFSNRTARISLGSAPAGLYLVQLRDSAGKNYTLKFVVAKDN